MGSYKPRHLKQESSVIKSLAGRRGVAVAASAAAIVPATMTEAHAAPVAAKPVVAAVAPKAAPAAIKTATVVTLAYGSRGYYVKVLQQRLGISADGIFGAGTKRAVINFQARKGLVRDGIVGAATWRALGGFPGATATTTSRSSSRASVASVAKRYIGVPYRWGGSTPAGFDCSGFVQYVFRQVGVSLPRTASQQQRVVARVSSPSTGDLFFNGWPASHVGIYLGNGLAIDARHPGTTIQIHTLWGSSNFGRA